MKILSWVTACVLVLSACQYNVPLSLDHTIPIEGSILGTWVIIPGEHDDATTEIRIHRFSDTEYAVHYHESSLDLYFRAYDIQVSGVSATQMELIGSDEGAIGADDEARYAVARYRLVNDQLEIRTLNTELLPDDLKTSDALEKAFIVNKDNPALFNDPGYFKRVTE